MRQHAALFSWTTFIIPKLSGLMECIRLASDRLYNTTPYLMMHWLEWKSSRLGLIPKASSRLAARVNKRSTDMSNYIRMSIYECVHIGVCLSS